MNKRQARTFTERPRTAGAQDRVRAACRALAAGARRTWPGARRAAGPCCSDPSARGPVAIGPAGGPGAGGPGAGSKLLAQVLVLDAR